MSPKGCRKPQQNLNIPEATASGDHREFSEAMCVFQVQEAAFIIKYML
jgi:hypothetical protein